MKKGKSHLKVVKNSSQESSSTKKSKNKPKYKTVIKDRKTKMDILNPNVINQMVGIKVIMQDDQELYLTNVENETNDIGLAAHITENICFFKNEEDAKSLFNDIKEKANAKEVATVSMADIKKGIEEYNKIKQEEEDEKDKHFVKVLDRETKKEKGYVIYEPTTGAFGIIATRNGSSYWDTKEKALTFIEESTPHLLPDVELQYEFFPGLKNREALGLLPN